jgi:hypothetical protein
MILQQLQKQLNLKLLLQNREMFYLSIQIRGLVQLSLTYY